MHEIVITQVKRVTTWLASLRGGMAEAEVLRGADEKQLLRVVQRKRHVLRIALKLAIMKQYTIKYTIKL